MRTDDALVVCSSTANSMEELSVTCYPETCLTSHFCLWEQSFLLGRATAFSHLSLSSTAVPAALGTETSIWDMIFRLICTQEGCSASGAYPGGSPSWVRCHREMTAPEGHLDQELQVSQGGRDIPLSHYDRGPGVGHWHVFSTGSQNRTKVAGSSGPQEGVPVLLRTCWTLDSFFSSTGPHICDRPFLDIGYLQPVSICRRSLLFAPNLGSRSHVHTGRCAICSPGPRLQPQSYMEFRFTSAGALFL